MKTTSGPRVIGCGHLHIRTKSGNDFPAFLVCLPRDAGKDECSYFWRTKRDFLLLNRSLRQHKKSGALTSTTFPKKAFNRLCDQVVMSRDDCSCRPWVRPDDDRAPSGDYCELINKLLGNEIRGAQNDRATNNFDPKLRKSLIQLDTFLETAHTLSMHSKSTSEGTRATPTSDDNDKESLQRADITIAEAWSIFCRLEDTENLVMPSTISKETEHNKNGLVANAAKLGQYFASDKNAKDVVSTVFKLLSDMKQINGSAHSDGVLFIEPSCGDGRIIEELLHSDENTESKMILGIDIDPISLEKAKEKFDGGEVILKCADFLSMGREQLLSDIPDTENMTVVALGGPPYTPKHLPEQFILHCVEELNAEIVVFIMPERCAKDADNIQKILNRKCVHDHRQWCYSNVELDNISFSFKDTTVQQPSILQSWYKQSRKRRAEA